MEKKLFIAGSIAAGLAVAIGTFGAHSLKDILVNMDTLDTFKTAVNYQFYHSFALLVLAWASSHWPKLNFKLAAIFFISGICLFSGSLYAYSLSKITFFALITPVGGILFIAAWFLTVYKLLQSEKHEQSQKR
ncbi:MAG: DUF423 domain-containing protein [Calditrichaeota bacterium]|nr:DUF423 domain-containing protein [Calditrichota bacterium]